MLRIFDSSKPNRREVMKVGALSLGGFGLSNLMAAKSHSAMLRSSMRGRSVVFLNLQGGPSQYETFDPKMTAPREIRSITGEVATSIPGVTFGGTLPMVAQLADKMAVVRSYRHGISNHGTAAMHVMAGGNPTGAMMGALFARTVGLTNEQSGLPQNALVTPRAVDQKHKDLYANIQRVSQTGSLSSIYKPFDPSAGGEILNNMRLNLDHSRLGDRRSLLRSIDLIKRTVDSSIAVRSADKFQRQAFDVLARGVADAFDLSKEDARLIERYDTSSMEPTDLVKSRNSYAQQFSPVALGKQLLMARRLCESGCGFVTVTCGGWDMHGGGKEFTMKDGIASLTPAIDKAVSAFISDIYQRGLDEKILFVITGEFGRTPRINKVGGRDHWGDMCPIAFVGGGLKMGQVVGKSDRIGAKPDSPPISSSQVLATIMHSLFDIGQLRLVSGIPADVLDVITGSEPIEELV